MVRSDSSAIAICISQATNFPQILTRLTRSLALSLLSHSPSSCTFVCDFVGLHMFSIDPFSLANAKIHNCPDFHRGLKCNATKTHATQCKQGACCIHIIIVLFSVCFFFSFSESVFEFRWNKDDKGKRRCWDSSKQWQGQLPSVCGERDAGDGQQDQAKSGECKRKSDSSTSFLSLYRCVTAQCAALFSALFGPWPVWP